MRWLMIPALLPVLAVGVRAADTEEYESLDWEHTEIEVQEADELVKSDDALVWDAETQATLERAFAVPLPRTTPAGRLLFTIEHRNREPLDEEPFHNFLGFDAGGLKIGLGLRYGLCEGLDVGVMRLNGTTERFDTYQLDGRWRLLREDAHLVDVAIIGGASWYVQQETDDASGAFGSLAIGRSFLRRIYLHAAGLYHADSTSADKTTEDDDESIAVMGSLHLRATSTMFVVGEISAPVAGFESNTAAWGAGLKWITHRHTFSILVANTQSFGLDGFAAGTAYEGDDMLIGFSITRELL